MHYVIGTVLDIEDKLMNKTDKIPAFLEHTGQRKWSELNVQAATLWQVLWRKIKYVRWTENAGMFIAHLSRINKKSIAQEVTLGRLEGSE